MKIIVCLFGEGARARSVVAEASGMAQKIVAIIFMIEISDEYFEGGMLQQILRNCRGTF